MSNRRNRHARPQSAAFGFAGFERAGETRRKAAMRELLLSSGAASVALVAGVLILFGELAGPALRPLGIALAGVGVAVDVFGVARFVLAVRALQSFRN